MRSWFERPTLPCLGQPSPFLTLLVPAHNLMHLDDVGVDLLLQLTVSRCCSTTPHTLPPPPFSLSLSGPRSTNSYTRFLCPRPRTQRIPLSSPNKYPFPQPIILASALYFGFIPLGAQLLGWEPLLAAVRALHNRCALQPRLPHGPSVGDHTQRDVPIHPSIHPCLHMSTNGRRLST